MKKIKLIFVWIIMSLSLLYALLYWHGYGLKVIKMVGPLENKGNEN